MLSSPYQPEEIILITSAPLTEAHREPVRRLRHEIDLRLIGRDELIEELARHPDLIKSRLLPAKKRKKQQSISLGWSLVGVISSIVGVMFSVVAWFFPVKSGLRERIVVVESAINNLKDLEHQLTEIKRDMVETERAKNALEQEYAKAKELEKLTSEQYEAIKEALRSQSWKKTLLDYILGFTLGVASSFTASIMYSRLQQRRALE